MSADAPGWLSLYGDLPATISPPYDNMLDVFYAAVRNAGGHTAIQYFDTSLSFGWLNHASDALACALTAQGFSHGDRLALFVQNNPSFVIGMIAAWKAGGSAVAINPMNKARELTNLLVDSGACGLVCLDDLYTSVVADVIGENAAPALRFVITTSPCDFQARNDSRVLDRDDASTPANTLHLPHLLAKYSGQRPTVTKPGPDDPAVLTYTSGTTGRPKAAVNTHRAISFNAYTYREWMGLRPDDAILAIAPLFHITGLVGHIGAALAAPSPVVLTHRFHPQVLLDAIAEHRPTFTVAAITALNSLVSASQHPDRALAHLRSVYSGGAAIPPATADDFRRRTGLSIHNCYGLTETTSLAVATPPGATAPVDPQTGALSIGVPVFNTTVRIVDDAGRELPTGEIGEIAIRGPQVVPGYWNRPDETAIVAGELRTGDIGYMNQQGWFFIVDRKKDMINASGYKVWPREVEDVLCAHPAVREAAVVGVPHAYRGETVRAFVSLHADTTATEDELIAYCKDNMAAYKYPRGVDVVEELPKTLSGKVLRRGLRDLAISQLSEKR